MDKNLNENNLKILTLNCQGLGDMNKRKDIFKILRSKDCNIYFLQDTHFTTDKENMIKAQWGYKAFFSSYQSNARGVSILVNNNFDFNMIREFKDVSGNYLILDVVIEDIPFLLINLYGPNSDTPCFYSELVNKILEAYSTQHIIIGGDFNLILDKELDSMNYINHNNPKATAEVLKLMDILNLKDIFRDNHPD